MLSEEKLADNVWAFIERASVFHGQAKAQEFAQEMQANCFDCGMQSPIEHLFWVACNAIVDAQCADLNPDPEVDDSGGLVTPDGIFIFTQTQVRQYRVDFSIGSKGFGPADVYTDVIVELDGHDFHDKDKRQRSYEKRRDRDLLREGYRVIHFTGSDVVKDPFACAWEALQMVGLFVGLGADDYDPNDPLGIRLR
jgi:very-short-patch-repair endonuclease